MKVKICGITRERDAELAVAFGAWAIGFVFYEGSSRHVAPSAAAKIRSRLPAHVKAVGVFVNEPRETILSVRSTVGLDLVQLHGDETPLFAEALGVEYIRAIRPKSIADVGRAREYASATALLIDACVDGQYGGTGRASDWALAREAQRFGSVLLSGGLNPENIRDALVSVAPFGVDVSSGVETLPGIKDEQKLRLFFERIHP